MKGAGDGGNGIKYIGQHVFDFVSSFRNTVNIGTDALDADLFLNNLDNLSGDIPSGGKVLVINTANKTGYLTFAQLLAELGSGDITSVAVATSSADHSKTSGAFALTFTGGPGIGLGLTGSSTGATNGELTINSDIATTSSIGAASFSSDNFAVSGAGVVTIKTGGIDLTSEVTNRLPIASGGTNSNSASDARTALGVDAAGTDNSTNVTLAGSLDYITISGQEITRNAIDLTTDITGVLESAFLDSDTSHLSVAQTFTGAKTFGTTTKLLFRDANSYIHSPTANDLKVSATDILLDAAGPIYLDAGAANPISFQEAGTTIANISAHHSATYLNMYENEGASTDDYFEIKTAAAGATTITTVDAAGTDADLDFAIDGTFSVASTGIDIATDGTITNATWQGSSIATTYTAAKVTLSLIHI